MPSEAAFFHPFREKCGLGQKCGLGPTGQTIKPPPLQLLVKRFLIIIQHQGTIALAFTDETCCLLLTVHGLQGHRGAHHFQQLDHLLDSGDRIVLATRFHLAQNQTIDL